MRLFLIIVSVLITALTAKHCHAREPSTEIDIFVSPLCGLSVQRVAEVVPLLGAAQRAGGFIVWHLVPLTNDQGEEQLLMQLVCAAQQGALPPMFLYIGNSAARGEKPQVDSLLEAFGISRAIFKTCMGDPLGLRATISRDHRLLFARGQSGVPAVTFRGRSYILTNFREIVSALP